MFFRTWGLPLAGTVLAAAGLVIKDYQVAIIRLIDAVDAAVGAHSPGRHDDLSLVLHDLEWLALLLQLQPFGDERYDALLLQIAIAALPRFGRGGERRHCLADGVGDNCLQNGARRVHQREMVAQVSPDDFQHLLYDLAAGARAEPGFGFLDPSRSQADFCEGMKGQFD